MSLRWTKILLLYFLIIARRANSIRYPHFRNVKAHWSPKYFSNFTLLIRNNSLYANIDILKNMRPGFKSHIDVQIRLTGSKAYQTLFAYKLDVCSVLISLKNTIFKKWFQSVLKAGNFMQNCPIYSGHYYLNAWRLPPDLVPNYLYAGNYRLKLHVFYGKYKGKDEDFVADIDLEIDLLDQA